MLQNLSEGVILSLGGRPRKDVPEDRIKMLSKQGMGVRDISRKLKITPSMISRVFNGEEVPAVLLSGDHEKIRLWRRTESLRRTLERRPDLLKKAKLRDEDKVILAKLQADHQ